MGIYRLRNYLKPQMQIEVRAVHFCSCYIDIKSKLEQLNATFKK